jgi:hypothetical protein
MYAALLVYLLLLCAAGGTKEDMPELLPGMLRCCVPGLCRLPAAAESTEGLLALVTTQRSARDRLHASMHQDPACSNTSAQHTRSATD